MRGSLLWWKVDGLHRQTMTKSKSLNFWIPSVSSAKWRWWYYFAWQWQKLNEMMCVKVTGVCKVLTKILVSFLSSSPLPPNCNSIHGYFLLVLLVELVELSGPPVLVLQNIQVLRPVMAAPTALHLPLQGFSHSQSSLLSLGSPLLSLWIFLLASPCSV